MSRAPGRTRPRGGRSSTTRRTDGRTPYARLFEMALLELERARRDREKEAARRKLDEIETRLREIEQVIDARRGEFHLGRKP